MHLCVYFVWFFFSIQKAEVGGSLYPICSIQVSKSTRTAYCDSLFYTKEKLE